MANSRLLEVIYKRAVSLLSGARPEDRADRSHAFGRLLDALAESGLAPSDHPKPTAETHPDFEAELVRPDDLLSLHVTGYNLQVASGDGASTLGRIDVAKDAFLVVTFPPQNIAETAYYLAANPTPLPPLPPSIPVQPLPPPGSPPPPGETGARLARVSRLVFRIAANAEIPTIPYSIEGLLDWSSLDLAVSPLADV